MPKASFLMTRLIYKCLCDVTAPSNVMDHVVLERDRESTVVFVEGARDAYLGYVTIKVRIA